MDKSEGEGGFPDEHWVSGWSGVLEGQTREVGVDKLRVRCV